MATDKRKVLVVGGGKMGEGIIAGWLAATEEPAASLASADVTVVEPSSDRRDALAHAYGVSCIEDASMADEQPDVVVLAVKPQVMGSVLKTIAQCPALTGAQAGPLYISIAAGLPTSSLESALPVGTPVVRVMPNMPLAIGAGASGVCGGACATSEQVDYVSRMFGCLGVAVIVDESQMDIVCALSGSGPAYVAAMVEALRDGAVEQGLEPSLAEALALQTVLGAARLIAETGASPSETRESICSPGGTTLAALDALYSAGFNEMFQSAIDAAVKRSKELAQC